MIQRCTGPKTAHRKGQNTNIVKECIDEEDGENSGKINIVLVTEKVSDHEIFVAEDTKSAVVDTACTIIVTGEPWFKNYCKRLDYSFLNEIEICPSMTTPFKFGDGKKVLSFQMCISPSKLAN